MLNHSQEYLKIVNDSCKALERPDLVGKIKLGFSKYHMIYTSYTYSRYGNVFGYCSLNRIKKIIYPKIIIPRGFHHLTDKGKEQVLKHETCHIVDARTPNNDISVENGGHGDSFKILLEKIGAPMSIDNSEIEDKIILTPNFKSKFTNRAGYIFASYQSATEIV
jgi:hypothetical protein